VLPYFEPSSQGICFLVILKGLYCSRSVIVVKCLHGDVLCGSSARKEGSLFEKLLSVQIFIQEEACISWVRVR
jgi:hypothetical protein